MFPCLQVGINFDFSNVPKAVGIVEFQKADDWGLARSVAALFSILLEIIRSRSYFPFIEH